jgi:hypothetical protein
MVLFMVSVLPGTMVSRILDPTALLPEREPDNPALLALGPLGMMSHDVEKND